MFQLLLTKRWLVWMTVAVVGAIACVLLGLWQWDRWETKHALQSQIGRNYDATPVSLRSVLPSTTTPLPKDREWSQVSLTGTYQDSQRLLARNRPLSSTFGYEVLVPLRLTDGSTVLVDRGWVPNGPNAATPPAVPPSPSGSVTVVGWLRRDERDLGRTPIPGQVSSINVAEAQRQTGTSMYDAYVLLRSERLPSGATPPRPSALEKPELGSSAGINLSYGVQWWLAAIAMPAYVLLMIRRDARDQDPAHQRALRPKKVRIWDEEDA